MRWHGRARERRPRPGSSTGVTTTAGPSTSAHGRYTPADAPAYGKQNRRTDGAAPHRRPRSRRRYAPAASAGRRGPARRSLRGRAYRHAKVHVRPSRRMSAAGLSGARSNGSSGAPCRAGRLRSAVRRSAVGARTACPRLRVPVRQDAGEPRDGRLGAAAARRRLPRPGPAGRGGADAAPHWSRTRRTPLLPSDFRQQVGRARTVHPAADSSWSSGRRRKTESKVPVGYSPTSIREHRSTGRRNTSGNGSKGGGVQIRRPVV